jgi:hypothetical protein
MRSGARLQISDKMIHGESVAPVADANPVSWLDRPPAGYAGEIKGISRAELPPGTWFYDVERRELGYIPRLQSHLSADAERPVLRWAIRYTKSKYGEVEDLALVPVTPYAWF